MTFASVVPSAAASSSANWSRRGSESPRSPRARRAAWPRRRRGGRRGGRRTGRRSAWPVVGERGRRVASGGGDGRAVFGLRAERVGARGERDGAGQGESGRLLSTWSWGRACPPNRREAEEIPESAGCARGCRRDGRYGRRDGLVTSRSTSSTSGSCAPPRSRRPAPARATPATTCAASTASRCGRASGRRCRPASRSRCPPGVAGLVTPRSGLAARHGISLVNSPGLIDPNYRGELRVVLVNLGDARFEATRRRPDRPAPARPVHDPGRAGRRRAAAVGRRPRRERVRLVGAVAAPPG